MLEDGLVRIGGRFKHAPMVYGEKNPVVLPKGHNISSLLVSHYYKQVKLQGHHFTEGAIRSSACGSSDARD